MNNENLFLRLVTKKDFEAVRRKYIGPIVHKLIGDLCLVAVRKPSELIPENLYSLSVRDVEIDFAGEPLIFEKILATAGWNTRNQMPPRVYFAEKIGNMDLYHSGIIMEDEIKYGFSEAVIDKRRAINGIRLTTCSWFGGAVSIFYPGVARRISSLLNSDLYVTFPSVHEARVHSTVWNNAYDVHDAITRWRRVKYGDYKGLGLSGKVYRYCAIRDEFQTVDYYDWNC